MSLGNYPDGPSEMTAVEQRAQSGVEEQLGNIEKAINMLESTYSRLVQRLDVVTRPQEPSPDRVVGEARRNPESTLAKVMSEHASKVHQITASMENLTRNIDL